MSAGNFADACPKLEESEKLDPGMGTLYNLGDCYEHVGKTASAWAAFDEVANEARAAGQPTREQDARGRASTLAPQLSHLTIDAAAVKTLDGLTVKRDGTAVGAPEWGTAIPIDPGAHAVTASANGKKDWSVKINVLQHENAVVKLPPLEDAPLPPPGPITQPSTMSNDTAQSDGKTQRTLGLALAGVGVVALGTGVVLTLISKGEESTANSAPLNCDPVSNKCPTQEGADARSTALVEGNVATVVLIAGLAFAGGGIALWATAPKSQKPTTGFFSVRPDVAVGNGGAALGMRGRW